MPSCLKRQQYLVQEAISNLFSPKNYTVKQQNLPKIDIKEIIVIFNIPQTKYTHADQKFLTLILYQYRSFILRPQHKNIRHKTLLFSQNIRHKALRICLLCQNASNFEHGERCSPPPPTKKKKFKNFKPNFISLYHCVSFPIAGGYPECLNKQHQSSSLLSSFL